MSRKQRELRKNFKVFCEGDTEYDYIDAMRRQQRLAITLKPINMKGGGYSSFLESLRKDGNTNCLAKFVIIDGDRAVSEPGERKKLWELLEYCILQNGKGRIPHILIVNYPDFEYIACLHTPNYKNQNVGQYIMKQMGYRDIDAFKSDSQIYDVLNSKGNSIKNMLTSLRREKCFVVNECIVDKNKFEIKVDTTYDWEKLGQRGSNFNEYFEVLKCFDVIK